MATLEGTATTVKEIIQEVAAFLIDPANFPSGTEWKLLSPSTITSTTEEVILCGCGDGKDEIYVGMKLDPESAKQENILLNGFAGYDANLEWYEQPGSIYKDALPCITLPKDVKLSYWVTANTSRFTIHVEESNHYEAAYLGFMQPVAVERQYPYPLVIGGSAYKGISWSSYEDAHSYYGDPRRQKTKDAYGKEMTGDYSALCLRRPDGVWRYGGIELMVWPTDTQPVDTFTVYVKTATTPSLEDHMLCPLLLYENDPVGILGQLDGVYFIGNRADLAAKDNVIYKDKTYKIFNNVDRRDDDQYHAVEWS